MKTKDLRELSVEELMGQENELAKGLFNLRFQNATGQLGNHTSIRKAKKDIARIKTIVKEKRATGDNAEA